MNEPQPAPEPTPEQKIELTVRHGFKKLLREKGIRASQEYLIAIGTGFPLPEEFPLDRERFLQIGREEMLQHFSAL